MKWIELRALEFPDYSYSDWKNGIELGFLISFSHERGIIIIDCNSMKLVFEGREYAGRKVNYFIFDQELYFSIEQSIYKFDFRHNSLMLKCRSNEEFIWMLNKFYCIGITSKRTPRINKNEILRFDSCEPIYTWNFRAGVVFIENNGYTIFEYSAESLLRAMEIEAGGKVLWDMSLKGFSFPRFYQNVSEEMFLVMQCFDTEHPVDKRYELWGIDKKNGNIIYKLNVGNFNRFVYSEDLQKLFGIHGQEYKCVDPFSGNIICSKKLPELGTELNNLWANLGNQNITGNDIFFTISGKPIVGRFNIQTEIVEEFIEIPVNKDKVDMRQPLNMPFYYQGRLYVRDNSGMMHIMEEQSHSFT